MIHQLLIFHLFLIFIQELKKLNKTVNPKALPFLILLFLTEVSQISFKVQ